MIIASKTLGTDTASGLEKRLDVHHIAIDAKGEQIVITYDIVLVSPTGMAVGTIATKTYRRFNKPETEEEQASMKFDELRDSAIGQGIISLIQKDLDAYDGTDESLEIKPHGK